MAISIRKDQMAVFEQAAVSNFENGMVGYLRENFPKPCEALGENRIRNIIRYGMDRAKSYGVTESGGVNLYINLMFMLGSQFDTDMQLPWADAILRDDSMPGEATRMGRLYDRAMDYLDSVAGANREHVDEALRRIREEPNELTPSSPATGLLHHMVLTLKRVFPQKFDYVGEAAVERVALNGIKSAKSYGITSDRGLIVYVGMMFMLGSAFDSDPQFPWAAEALNKNVVADQDEKVEALYAEAMTRLEQWLKD